MNNRKHILAALLTAGIASAPFLHGQTQEEQEVRTIRLLQDDGQVNIVSKVYELKYLKATDIRPFIESEYETPVSTKSVESSS